ncbi:hypothetical protein DU475_02955 [Rhodopseudomonas sp. WA056]|uniref:VPA1262 family N-terminal domain-containing protein n=1 Tax=Rhodopseudomonas sp. WA056 TaxID=2269367 RepID=UPI0013DE8030|nr:VPA1262 family N-terminal domain-containing protein [Rhodopseudomonas sp. WA056]NEW86220.1 hypothetical protein [Rhodopseudomonas sp. WA056]
MVSTDRTNVDFKRLTASGLLGFFTHVEATEIFALRGNDPTPFNVFSILVAEERDDPPGSLPPFVGTPIQIKQLKGWKFGIKRTILQLNSIEPLLNNFQNTGKWEPSGEPLRIGTVTALPTQFIPPDSTVVPAWNHVLKNNFWSGSYVVELADTEKLEVRQLIDNPPALQELSAAIQKRIPLRIASLSDRLGNIVFQIPASIIVVQFAKDRTSGDATVNLAWHPKATPRPIRAMCQMEHDNVLTGYSSAEILGSSATLPMAAGPGMQRGVIWDDQNGLVLAATSSTGFINTIAMNMKALDPEPRVFTLKDAKGNAIEKRIPLASGSTVQVGPVSDERSAEWTRKRIYRDEAARLAAERVFVQYKPQPGGADLHEKALEDIRVLINRHGEFGAWLWDPYLSADDILRTLFFSRHTGAAMRALSAAKTVASSVPSSLLADTQRAVFAAANSNLRGLKLEFRMKVGQAGWAFHDRFLIFPIKDGGALAWSLGTSVNRMGRQHHILQRVDDGQLIADAFNELWEALGQAEHLIWKTP